MTSDTCDEWCVDGEPQRRGTRPRTRNNHGGDSRRYSRGAQGVPPPLPLNRTRYHTDPLFATESLSDVVLTRVYVASDPLDLFNPIGLEDNDPSKDPVVPLSDKSSYYTGDIRESHSRRKVCDGH